MYRCPGCGKIINKKIQEYSAFKCRKCKNFIYLENGVVKISGQNVYKEKCDIVAESAARAEAESA